MIRCLLVGFQDTRRLLRWGAFFFLRFPKMDQCFRHFDFQGFGTWHFVQDVFALVLAVSGVALPYQASGSDETMSLMCRPSCDAVALRAAGKINGYVH